MNLFTKIFYEKYFENFYYLQDNVSAEVSFHMARPATVISNNSTSPNNSVLSGGSAVNNSGLSNISENPQNNNSADAVKNKPDQPETGNMNKEWTSLVDTATKAIYENTSDNADKNDNHNSNQNAQQNSRNTVNATPGQDMDLKSLLDKVSSLEAELKTERQGRTDLEQQVEQLKEENVRLKEESQTAAQQLRRFTEWFFQTIDKS